MDCFITTSWLVLEKQRTKFRRRFHFKFPSFSANRFYNWIGYKTKIKKIEDDKIADGTMKKCQFCAEIIKNEAKVCRYYRKELE